MNVVRTDGTSVHQAAGMSESAGPAVLSVQHASKAYNVYSRQADRLWELLRRRPLHRQMWALQDVSFDVHAGEIVGIIGRNGAGKTTLLRLIAGIARLTSGTIQVHAPLATILELGTGFHPEFTGRENVYLGGALLGLSRREVAARFDGIAAFAELGDYLDLPFKTYSLGMQARLTFALAISVDADILIIDEALAAGDSYFIAKCFERIRTICESGKTVLFVSHNLHLVQRLCGRVLWLDQGRLLADGLPAEVCPDYEAAIRKQEAARLAREHPTGAAMQTLASGRRYGTQEAQITRFEILDEHRRPAAVLESGRRAFLRVYYQGVATGDNIVVAVLLTRTDGVAAAGLSSDEHGLAGCTLSGSGYFEIELQPVVLGPGEYFASPHLYRDRPLAARHDVLDYHDRLYRFRVARRGRPYDIAVEQPACWRHHVLSGSGAMPSEARDGRH